MLWFVILIGTIVNNPILIVPQALNTCATRDGAPPAIARAPRRACCRSSERDHHVAGMAPPRPARRRRLRVVPRALRGRDRRAAHQHGPSLSCSRPPCEPHARRPGVGGPPVYPPGPTTMTAAVGSDDNGDGARRTLPPTARASPAASSRSRRRRRSCCRRSKIDPQATSSSHTSPTHIAAASRSSRRPQPAGARFLQPPRLQCPHSTPGRQDSSERRGSRLSRSSPVPTRQPVRRSAVAALLLGGVCAALLVTSVRAPGAHTTAGRPPPRRRPTPARAPRRQPPPRAAL